MAVASSPPRTESSNTNSSLKGITSPQASERRRVRQLWKFRLRPDDDEEDQYVEFHVSRLALACGSWQMIDVIFPHRDWWFASTAIPLLAATTGPLANLLSLAALVTPWRQNRLEDGYGRDADAVGFRDPRWCLVLNGVSLACGFAGNFFLLMNFTRRIRYIVALPMTIILWYAATGILIAIIVAMDQYVPPIAPKQTYSQGFWYAIIAAVLYLCSSMALMVNMMGYFLGHYPQYFTLTDHQRTLILQTMMFVLWLAGGAGVFARVCGWSYVDALYFCDVTILTVGFGDYAPPNDLGRGLVFPFSVGGIIMLGLMVGSINRFSSEISRDKIIKMHVERKRQRTLGRTLTGDTDTTGTADVVSPGIGPVPSSGFTEPRGRTISFVVMPKPDRSRSRESAGAGNKEGEAREHRGSFASRIMESALTRQITPSRLRPMQMLQLEEERDRFDAMRGIQYSTQKFKRYYNLLLSVAAFALVWCGGAAVFKVAERREQDLTYFQALYFCYVSLLTIGYGDLAPKSNAGKPFFVVWSLVAVPTMTILIGDMADTVIRSFKNGTVTLGHWTVLPQAGLWQSVLDRLGIFAWLQRRADRHAEDKRIAEGFPVADEIEDPMTLEDLADGEPTEHDLAKRLAFAIRRTANHLHADPPRRYSYEEWAEYTRLIRFSSETEKEAEAEETTYGLINWDWIGEDSPMLAKETEAEWILDRLCESLVRYMSTQARKRRKRKRRKSQIAEQPTMKSLTEGLAEGGNHAVTTFDGDEIAVA